MFAVVKISGRQYRLALNERVKVDLLEVQPGDEVVINDVMMVSDGTTIEIGTPTVPYKVKFEAVEHGRHKKVNSYHFKRRAGRRRLHGHRQDYTLLKVKSIDPEN